MSQLLATLMVIFSSNVVWASGDGLSIPNGIGCDSTMVQAIYRAENGALIARLEAHFLQGRDELSAEEFCRQIASEWDGTTEATACEDCVSPEPAEIVRPDEFERSGLGANDVRVIQSHARPQSTSSNLFSNPFVQGLAGGFFGGLVGGFAGAYLFDKFGNAQPSQPNYPQYPPGMLPLQPPGMLRYPGGYPGQFGQYPGMYGQAPGMIGMPGQNYNLPWSGGYPGSQFGGGYPGFGMTNPGSPAYTGMPGYSGVNGVVGGSSYYPYMGDSYFGSLPSYYYGSGQYSSGIPYGSNPYTAPAILPMPQSTR